MSSGTEVPSTLGFATLMGLIIGLVGLLGLRGWAALGVTVGMTVATFVGLRAFRSRRGLAIHPGKVGYGIPAFEGIFRQEYIAAGGKKVLGAPSDLVHVWGEGVIQNFSGGAEEAAVIMAVDPDSAVVLAGGAWFAYDRIGGGRGRTVEYVGYPIRVEDRVDGGAIIRLRPGPKGDGDSAVVRGPNSRKGFFWIPPAIWRRYLELGGPVRLGYPIAEQETYPGGVRQRFECGALYQQSDGAVLTETEYHQAIRRSQSMTASPASDASASFDPPTQARE
jgi:uncharacterized protein with LGFP repeats